MPGIIQVRNPPAFEVGATNEDGIAGIHPILLGKPPMACDHNPYLHILLSITKKKWEV